MTYLAKDYIPVTVIKKTPTVSEATLDMLSARYIKALRFVSVFTSHVVTSREVGRLDLIANLYYDDRSDLIQPLARYNKIVNLLTEVYVGRTILVPSIAALEEALQSANTKQITDNTYITLR